MTAQFTRFSPKTGITFDQTSLPLLWIQVGISGSIFGTKIGLKATFIQSGKYSTARRGMESGAVGDRTPSRIEVRNAQTLLNRSPTRQTHHRFVNFAEALGLIRTRIDPRLSREKPIYKKLCAELGIPADFDISLITWKPTTTLSITSSSRSALVASTVSVGIHLRS